MCIGLKGNTVPCSHSISESHQRCLAITPHPPHPRLQAKCVLVKKTKSRGLDHRPSNAISSTSIFHTFVPCSLKDREKFSPGSLEFHWGVSHSIQRAKPKTHPRSSSPRRGSARVEWWSKPRVRRSGRCANGAPGRCGQIQNFTQCGIIFVEINKEKQQQQKNITHKPRGCGQRMQQNKIKAKRAK